MASIKQEQNLKLGQKLSPKQILFTRLLEVPSFQMEQRIQQELVDNPALEIAEYDEDEKNEKDIDQDMDDQLSDSDSDNQENDFPDNELSEYDSENDMMDYFSDDDDRDALYRHISNHSPDDEEREIPIVSKESFLETLKQQLGLFHFNESDQQIAEYILGNIDESGYLQRNAKGISNDLLFNMNIRVSPERIQEIIDEIIHRIEPAGVGASNLQECLLLQLERMPKEPTTVLATTIITKTFPEFTKKNYDKIRSKTHCSEEEFRKAIALLVKLDPKPGFANNDIERESAYISPDFVVYYNDKTDKLELSMPKYNIPELCVRKAYRNLYEEIRDKKNISKNERKIAMDFVRQKVTAAEWFIESLNQRENTLFRTMECIINYQRTFFQTGDETTIRPMILKNIAEMTGMNISTISRITSSKYVLTPYGMYPLKFFFSESMEKEGEEVSSREIKKIIQDTIDGENKDKPLTDDDLQNFLKEKGYNIARRTVAKYREQMGYMPSRMRK